jgi:hypothetical protein
VETHKTGFAECKCLCEQFGFLQDAIWAYSEWFSKPHVEFICSRLHSATVDLYVVFAVTDRESTINCFLRIRVYSGAS